MGGVVGADKEKVLPVDQNNKLRAQIRKPTIVKHANPEREGLGLIHFAKQRTPSLQSKQDSSEEKELDEYESNLMSGFIGGESPAIARKRFFPDESPSNQLLTSQVTYREQFEYMLRKAEQGSANGRRFYAYFHEQDKDIQPQNQDYWAMIRKKEQEEEEKQQKALELVAKSSQPSQRLDTPLQLSKQKRNSLFLDLTLVQQFSQRENDDYGDPDFEMYTSRSQKRTRRSIKRLEREMIKKREKQQQEELEKENENGRKTKKSKAVGPQALSQAQGENLETPLDESAIEVLAEENREDFFVRGNMILQIERGKKKMSERKQLHKDDLLMDMIENQLRPTELVLQDRETIIEMILSKQNSDALIEKSKKKKNHNPGEEEYSEVRIKAFKGYEKYFKKDIKSTLARLAKRQQKSKSQDNIQVDENK